VEDNKGKEADVEGNPSRGAKPAYNLIIIARGISVGTKMKQKEMDCYSYDE
jgi:hypothetical protein